MGRWSTGAQTCESTKRIELTHLLKQGYLQKGKMTDASYSWNRRGEPNGEIKIISYLGSKEIYIRLVYSLTDRTDNQKYEYDYKIFLTSIPSNLGKGEVLYFLCPVSGKRCRVLYCAYGYHKWKSREAYQNRLYYGSQTSSKKDYANDRYWALERKIEEIRAKKYFKHTYDGKVTRQAIHLQKLELQKMHWDEIRWSPETFPYTLRKRMFGE